MVKAEQMQDRRVQVMHMDRVLNGSQTDGIGRSVSQAAAHARSRQPDGIAPGIVIASLTLFAHRHPSELATPDHQRVVEQPALPQIAQQTGDRLIGLATHRRVIVEHIRVSIPTVRVSGINLHEADAPLDHSASQ